MTSNILPPQHCIHEYVAVEISPGQGASCGMCWKCGYRPGFSQALHPDLAAEIALLRAEIESLKEVVVKLTKT